MITKGIKKTDKHYLQENRTFTIYRKVLTFLLIFVTLGNVFLTVYQNKNEYFSHDFWQRYPKLKLLYYDSQYAHEHHKSWISDTDVNAFAGASYIKGASPILIAVDTPPLGRYLIGLSTILFNNENIITLVFSLLSLGFLFLIGKQIFNSTVLALVPGFLFSFEPLFKNEISTTPLLDITQLLFLSAAMYFFNKGILQKKFTAFFALGMIFLGCFISTKFFATGVTVLAAWFIYLLIHKEQKRFTSLLYLLPIPIVILYGTYIRVLFTNYGTTHFLGIQKYVFLYHKSQLILPFSIWPLILLDKWYVWFGNSPVISDQFWQVTWPVVTVGSIITMILYVFKKLRIRSKPIEVLMLWIIFYLLFYSFGQIASRYLLIILPMMYIVSTFGVWQFFLWRRAK